MKELWEEASQYGRVHLYQADNGKYSCWIEFNTIKNVELKAKHQGYCDSPEEALKAATKKAKEIVDSISSIKESPIENTVKPMGERLLDKLKGF